MLFIDFSLASLPSIGYAARKVACGTPQQYQNTSLEHEIHTILKLKKNFLLAQCSMIQCQNNVTFQWVIALVLVVIMDFRHGVVTGPLPLQVHICIIY